MRTYWFLQFYGGKSQEEVGHVKQPEVCAIVKEVGIRKSFSAGSSRASNRCIEWGSGWSHRWTRVLVVVFDGLFHIYAAASIRSPDGTPSGGDRSQVPRISKTTSGTSGRTSIGRVVLQ